MTLISSRLSNNNNNNIINNKNYNGNLIIILVGTAILCGILFFFSKSFRVSRVISNMDIYVHFQNWESMNTSLLKKYRLADFYINSSINTALSGYQMFDYVSTDMVKKTLQSGARYLEFQVFADSYNKDAIPIVSTGFEKGEWKLSLNTLKFEDVIQTLRKHAFRVYDGTDGSPNYRDPLFIGLNLKTNNNYLIHNKIQTIINKYFLDYLLDPSYNYQAKNLGIVPLVELMGKVIIFASDGFQGSSLDEIVNYSWDYAKMKRIHASELLAHDVVSTNDTKYNKELEQTKNNIEINQLKKFNFNNLSIVYPQLDGEFFTYNQDPTKAWDLGCQFVCMNYQSIDREMDKYISKFRNNSFVLKPKHLRI
jgi:hypothetical protein